MQGGLQGQLQDPREQFSKRKNNKQKAIPKTMKLVNTKERLIVKGIQFNSDSLWDT